MAMNLPTAQELFDAGVHVGHQLRRWNPRSKPFVYAHRHGISIIDLAKTLEQLAKACEFVEHLVAGGSEVWLVGTKPQAKDIVREAAEQNGLFYCTERWLGGTLTNFATIGRGLQKYRRLLQMQERGEIDRMFNKEAAALRRTMARMGRNFGGLLDIAGQPGALIVVDINRELIAVREAKRTGTPVVAIADTNTDPFLVDYPIPGNDDSGRSVRILLDAIVQAILRGREERELRREGKAIEMKKMVELEPEVVLSDEVTELAKNLSDEALAAAER
jgi:small subunit ribosomal protein S2